MKERHEKIITSEELVNIIEIHYGEKFDDYEVHIDEDEHIVTEVHFFRNI